MTPPPTAAPPKDDTKQPAAEQAGAAETAMEQRPPAGAPAATTKIPVRMGLAPQSLDEAWRMSQFMANSELVPKGYRNKPADVLVAIQYGMELGFAPMQALQSIAVINGKPGIYGDGFLALIISSPLCRDHDEHFEVAGARCDGITIEDLKKDDTTAVCTFWRQGKQLPVTRRFSVGQAKKANLLGKDGPWSSYPDRMLMMRARGFAGRDAFSDLLRGLKTAEELADIPSDEPIDVVVRQEPVQPRRASEAPQAAASSSASPNPPAPAGNPTPAPAKAEGETELRGLLITNTQFVKPKAGEPYYEITAKSATGAPLTFLTRDEQVYKEARSFEGTDHRVVVGVHEQPKTGDKAKVLVLDRIGIYEGGEPAADGLFTE